jgi:hypothetical protein
MGHLQDPSPSPAMVKLSRRVAVSKVRMAFNGRGRRRPDLLVTDVGLANGINGRQVAEAARERQPNLPVLFIAGYAGTSLPPGVELTDKPFDLDLLVQRVGAILEAGRGPPPIGAGMLKGALRHASPTNGRRGVGKMVGRRASAARHALADLALDGGALARAGATDDLLHDGRRYAVPLGEVGDLLLHPNLRCRISSFGLRLVGLGHGVSLASGLAKARL